MTVHRRDGSEVLDHRFVLGNQLLLFILPFVRSAVTDLIASMNIYSKI
jgi:hypothetical protein